jgi:Fe-S-cluster-containing dehydrogenase component
MADVCAHRDLKLCSKDCLCLFVCPTGATNNETGQIDAGKCIGCGACANACPAKAISMIPNVMPKQQEKTEEVIKSLFNAADNKIKEINILKSILENANEDNGRFIKALIHSNKVIIEDLMREAGFMLPQSKNAHEFLKGINNDEIKEIVEKLLKNISIN